MLLSLGMMQVFAGGADDTSAEDIVTADPGGGEPADPADPGGGEPADPADPDEGEPADPADPDDGEDKADDGEESIEDGGVPLAEWAVLEAVFEDGTVVMVSGLFPLGAYIEAYPVELELEDEIVLVAVDIS
ncbi:MAG: hypothetical protein GX823_03215, partial [Clostridiales bacterium]|nr:hypothetical protein [Clostridiales bacterium]